MKQKDLLGIASRYLKELPYNQFSEFPSELREALSNVSRYQKASSYPESLIGVFTLKGKNRNYKSLVIKTPTGSEIPVTKSRLKLGSGRKKKASESPRQKIVRLFRESVTYQIDEYRANYKKAVTKYSDIDDTLGRCTLSNKYLFNGKTDVDHLVPFSWLLDRWFESHTSFDKFTDIPLEGQDIYSYYKESWIKYHQENAILRMSLSKYNVQRSSEGYRSKY